MGEDLMVSVTIEEFEQEKSIDKKLNLMFKVLSAQQEGCVKTVEGFINVLIVWKRAEK